MTVIVGVLPLHSVPVAQDLPRANRQLVGTPVGGKVDPFSQHCVLSYCRIVICDIDLTQVRVFLEFSDL